MNPTETNPLHAIIALASAKISTLPTLPFDLIVKVALHYIQENPEKILDSYHYIQNHISKKEKQSLIIDCFASIYEESIDEWYEEEMDSEYVPRITPKMKKSTKKKIKEIEERNKERKYSTSLIDLVIYKSKKNKQILKNFSSMIFEIEELLSKEILRTILNINSFYVLPFEKHNLFSLDLLKILYANKQKNIWAFLKACSASNVEILEFLYEQDSVVEIFGSGKYFYEFFQFAEKLEDVDMFEWLFSKGMQLDSSYYMCTKSLKCFEWLYSKNCKWWSGIYLEKEELISFAIEKGLKFGELDEPIEFEEFNQETWNTNIPFVPHVPQELGENPW